MAIPDVLDENPSHTYKKCVAGLPWTSHISIPHFVNQKHIINYLNIISHRRWCLRLFLLLVHVFVFVLLIVKFAAFFRHFYCFLATLAVAKLPYDQNKLIKRLQN